MLAIVSDLHVSDGTTANNFNPEALRILAERIKSAATDRGATELRLVLLGDILDFQRTRFWHDNVAPEDRPWAGPIDPATGMNRDAPKLERQFGDVLTRILHEDATRSTARAPGLQKLLSLLDKFATARGIPFRVTYVVGNHDRVLHNFPSLKRRVSAAFASLKTSDIVTGFRDRRYATVARHGHEWDVNTHGYEFKRKVLKGAKGLGRFDADAYRVMALGEVITAELMSGLIYHVEEGGGDSELVRQLKDLNNLRPAMHVFEWLDWLAEGRPSSGHGPVLHAAVSKALEGVLESDYAKRWDALKTDVLVSGDLVDRLQLGRSILLGRSYRDSRKRKRQLESLGALIEGKKDELFEGAEAEFETIGTMESSLPDWTQYLVYGHTHRPRRDYFSGDLDGSVRMYVNTGTYLPLISRASRGFAIERRMTTVFVYGPGEDRDGKLKGPSIDVWNGIRRKIYRR